MFTWRIERGCSRGTVPGVQEEKSRKDKQARKQEEDLILRSCCIILSSSDPVRKQEKERQSRSFAKYNSIQFVNVASFAPTPRATQDRLGEAHTIAICCDSFAFQLVHSSEAISQLSLFIWNSKHSRPGPTLCYLPFMCSDQGQSRMQILITPEPKYPRKGRRRARFNSQRLLRLLKLNLVNQFRPIVVYFAQSDTSYSSV